MQSFQAYSIPISIVIGAALVAGAIIFTNQQEAGPRGQGQAPEDKMLAKSDVKPTRSENRAIYGDTEAPVTIVEFSDYQCPYCARLHPTIKQIVDESEGGINWEYRHLPLPFHTSAEFASVVGECVYQKQGNEAFWEYGDLVLQNQRGMNQQQLIGFGKQLGLSDADIEACANDQSIAAQINADMAAAQALGGSGTPFSVIVFADGSLRPVSGALPYAQWVQLLNSNS